MVHNYTKREKVDVGFEVEIECNGEVFTFNYTNDVANAEKVLVANFRYSKTKGVNLLPGGIESNSNIRSTEVWGLYTNKFQEVTTIMNSPNYWDTSIGNQHLFLMLKGAENKDPLIRGFFNEQLPQHLMEHKRVFEALGAKLRVDAALSERQLSGLGFQLTKSNTFIAKVKGSSERIIKVVI